MSWHGKVRLPSIPPIGFDSLPFELATVNNSNNSSTAWRGYLDARERFQEAYDSLPKLRKPYGPEFRRGNAALPIVETKGACHHCEGKANTGHSYCGCDYNSMHGNSNAYGFDDPILDPFWSGSLGTTRRYVCHGGHGCGGDMQRFHCDGHSCAQPVRTTRTITKYVQQAPQTQVTQVVQAPQPPPPQLLPPAPMAQVPAAPYQPVYVDGAMYPRRPMVAVGFSFPESNTPVYRRSWGKCEQKLEAARSAYTANLSHLKRLGLTKFDSSCDCYGYSNRMVSYRW